MTAVSDFREPLAGILLHAGGMLSMGGGFGHGKGL